MARFSKPPPIEGKRMPQDEELRLALREMPQLDFGGERLSFKRSPFVSIAAR